MDNQNHRGCAWGLVQWTRPVWTRPQAVHPEMIVHEQSLQDVLEFLDMPREQRSPIMWDTVRASVEALAFLCRLRFSPSLQIWAFDSDNPLPNQLTNAADQNFSRKRKTAVPKESLASTLLRWTTILPKMKTKIAGRRIFEVRAEEVTAAGWVFLLFYSWSSTFVGVHAPGNPAICVYVCVLRKCAFVCDSVCVHNQTRQAEPIP